MKIFYIITITFISIVTFKFAEAQNTVGLISYDINNSYQGYTMIYPHNQPNVFLIDNCGEIVHSWTDEDNFRPGNTAYLRPDGSIVKTKREASSAGDNIFAGGGGAIVEIRSWENELIWSYELNNDTMRLHHDIAPMDNGNILMIAWELKTKEGAIEAGRDTMLLPQEELWPEVVFEINPETDEIVWEWHAWDHLIQDFDSTKANYGVIKDHKELINLNWDTNDGKSDWMHANSLDYNEELDQILISIPTFHEMWVIDHSTTTAQAAGHFGGFTNHGGDIIYRVGNPAAYDQVDTLKQISFYQHDAHWANEFLPDNHPFANSIVFFNNRLPNYSAVEIFDPAWNMYIGDYDSFEGAFPPFEFENTRTHPDTFSFYSTGLSSGQLLPNGNLLMLSGRQGYMVELTPEDEIVWEYITPLRMGNAVAQETMLDQGDNLTFRAFRYPPEYAAFESRDLTSKGFIEVDPDEEFCNTLVATNNLEKYHVKLYPNPATNMVHVSWDSGRVINLKVYDLLGRVRMTEIGNGGMTYLNVSELEPNMYILNLEGIGSIKFYVQK